jgi:putative phage-type endonuclease
MLLNQDFTQERAKYLGGSDIGAILGVSPYKTAIDVWMEKTGKASNQTDSLPLRFGSFAESFVADEYARATGYQLVSHEDSITHPKHEFIKGHVDRLVFINPSDTELPFNLQGHCTASKILECKTANPFIQSNWGEPGTDQVPMSYLCQTILYMALTNIDRTDLAVLFGNSDFRIYEITRDLELENMVLEKAVHFWQEYILKDQPPPAQNEADYRALFKTSSPTKSIETNQETCDLIEKLHKLNAQIEVIESEVSQIKQLVMAQMQDAEALTYNGKTLATWKAPKPSFRFDAKRLEQEHPDLIPLYQIPIQNARRLVIKGGEK